MTQLSVRMWMGLVDVAEAVKYPETLDDEEPY